MKNRIKFYHHFARLFIHKINKSRTITKIVNGNFMVKITIIFYFNQNRLMNDSILTIHPILIASMMKNRR